ncbi:MAG: tetratricopeptide repeat protein, partial [Candidatus Omnitrophica bacterium]|nr:tetratricopeptide repeat protein [Candidatus Omnitrophota bacterium]
YYYRQGRTFFSKKEYKDALAKFQESLDWDPQYKPSLKYAKLVEKRIVGQMRKEGEKKLVRDKEKLEQAEFWVGEKKAIESEKIKLREQHEEELLEHAVIAEEKAKGDIEEIIGENESRREALVAERETTSDQDLRRYYFKLGRSYFNKGKYKEALEKFQEALRLEPEYKPTSIYIDLIKHKILQEDVAEAVERD